MAYKLFLIQQQKGSQLYRGSQSKHSKMAFKSLQNPCKSLNFVNVIMFPKQLFYDQDLFNAKVEISQQVNLNFKCSLGAL